MSEMTFCGLTANEVATMRRELMRLRRENAALREQQETDSQEFTRHRKIRSAASGYYLPFDRIDVTPERGVIAFRDSAELMYEAKLLSLPDARSSIRSVLGRLYLR